MAWSEKEESKKGQGVNKISKKGNPSISIKKRSHQFKTFA